MVNYILYHSHENEFIIHILLSNIEAIIKILQLLINNKVAKKEMALSVKCVE